MAASVVDTVAAQMETVLPEVQEIYADSDQLYGKVKSTNKVEQISRYLLRWPLMQYVGGNFQKVSGNGGSGGSLGAGSSMKLTYLLAGYFYADIIFRLTQEQIDTSATNSQSVINVMSEQMAKGIRAQQIYDDVTFHQPGTGILTEPSSAIVAGANATMTFAGATDFLGINRLFEGMVVDVWDSTGATKRAAATAAPITIIAIDYDSKTVTFDQDVTTLTQGDLLALRNMDVYGPAALTSFASTYPGTQGGAAAGGIGGDSFRHGFPYFTDTTASNYFYSKQKSTIPQLNPVRVNANNDALQWEHGLRLVAKVKQKRPDKELWKNLRGIAHGTQKARVFELGMSISQKLMTGTEFGRSLDLVPDNQANADTFNFAGMECIESTRQYRDRIDFISFEKIGRAEAAGLKPFNPGGVTLFPGRGSDGTLQTYVEWAYMTSYDNVCFDNGFFGRIDTLAMPSSDWDA